MRKIKNNQYLWTLHIRRILVEGALQNSADGEDNDKIKSPQTIHIKKVKDEKTSTASNHCCCNCTIGLFDNKISNNAIYY